MIHDISISLIQLEAEIVNISSNSFMSFLLRSYLNDLNFHSSVKLAILNDGVILANQFSL